tara:strand:- start:747 stop:1226 length:480 start_codon:yes stop_codon:yes gene_type:complete
MKAREWTTVDKSSWGHGPWQSEPDKKQWTDEMTGFPCLIVRNGAGSLCGYVGVGPDHSFFDLDECESFGLPLSVHGGITFARRCNEVGDEGETVCHVAPKDVPRFWLGFDCSHLGDLNPGPSDVYSAWAFEGEEEIYRDINYVMKQCADLAQELMQTSV